jgi:hypothetical protein
MPRASDVPAFAALLQDYFCQRLIAQRDASPATVASYRDTFRLLLRYARDRIRKKPTELWYSGSSPTSRASAETARALATRASRPSVRSYNSPRSSARHLSRLFSVYSPSP